MADQESRIAAAIVDSVEPERFVRAVTLGMMADEVFEEECRYRGLRVVDALKAPLEFMELPPIGTRHQ
jgi:hypothetical protein